MLSTLGEVLPQAVAIAISPIPVALIILILVSARARANGPAFAVTWLIGIVVVCGAAVLLASGAGVGSEDSAGDGVKVVHLILGLAFLWLALRQWRARPRPGEAAATPKLFEVVDDMSVGKAAGVGLLASAVNPKNLVLAVSAGLTISEANLSGPSTTTTVVLFSVIASLTVVVAVLLHMLAGERASGLLHEVKDWLIHNNATILFVLFLVLAAKLIGSGLGVFSE